MNPDLSENHLYNAFGYVNTSELADKSVLVKIAQDLLNDNPDIDLTTYNYRLALKFHNYKPD